MVNIKYGHEVGSTALRVFDLDHGIPSDMDDFWAMRNFITSNSMAVGANYEQALGMLDMRSFIDHLILKIFAGDDHYAPEYVFWRARTPQDASFGDGRWRVIIKDFDSSLFTANYVTGLANGTHPRAFGYELFQSLLANPSFRNDFINRFADLLNAHFQPARFQSIIDTAYNEVQPVWNEMGARWNNVAFSNPNRPFTIAGRDALLSWSTVHPPRQRTHIRSHFGISGDVDLTVNVSNPAHGHVRVNTIDIKGTTPGLAAQPYPWTGTYFQNIPVKLAAQPASGYRFAGWRLDGGGTYHSVAEEIPLTFQFATSVEAVFEPLSSIHQWNFENSAGFLQPSQSVGGGANLSVTPDSLTEVLRNTASQNFTTAHLRVNNPLGAGMMFAMPSTGFGNLVLSWQTRRSGQGAGMQSVETTTDGVVWSPLASYAVADAAPQAKSFNLTGIPGVENNPLFAVRVTFSQADGGISGNHRFDDVSLSGILLPGGQPPASLAFGTMPAGTSSGAPLPSIQVRLLDAAGLPAVSFNGPVTLSLSGSGVLGGTLTVDAINGTATFSNLSITGTGAYQLIANADSLPAVTSSAFRSVSLTEMTVPQFIQGGVNGLDENNERVPFAWRGRIDGLAPGATYRFANRAVLATDTAASDGAGNMIFITGPSENWLRSIVVPGFLATDLGTGHSTFTAGSDGSFTGWFLTEPTGNARFTPGNSVLFRILLNDGSGGQAAAHILTTGQSAQVIRFGSTSGDGTALIGPSTTASRRIAMIFEDAEGATRPLAATPVESTGATVDLRFAPFYQIMAASLPNHWGTMIPNSLPGGVRRVEIRSAFDHALLETRTSPGGFAETSDPASGLSAILLGTDAGFSVFEPAGNAAWNAAAHWSTATVPDAPAAVAIIPGPAADRDIDINSAITLGSLRFQNTTPPFRNRLLGSALGSLTLQGIEQAAHIRLETSALGSRADLGPSLPVHLGSDLLVDDGGHVLGIAGPITGNGHCITKTGSGVLELAGTNAASAPPVMVQQGVLAISGVHPGAVSLAAGATLTGSGSCGAISGAGTVSVGNSALTASSSSASHLDANLTTPGGLTGNGALALADSTEPLPASLTNLRLYLHASRQTGDRFAGGLLVPNSIDLSAALASTNVQLFVADPAGGIVHLGQNYRAAEPEDLLTWSVVSLPQGKTLEVLQSGSPSAYTQWRNLHFPDATQRVDDGISGPTASVAGDGIANLIRYAHGVNPDAPVAHLLPRIAGTTGNSLDFRFRLDASKPDLAWVVRSSPDLGDWSTVIFDSRIHTPPAPDPEGWTSLPIPVTGEKRFLRLEIVAP
jgi:hypothetical protein